MGAAGGGAFTVDLEALHELAEGMRQFAAHTEEDIRAVHGNIEGIPMEGDTKDAAVEWADRWCSQADRDLDTVHRIETWIALAHGNYTRAGEVNVGLWSS